jgi:hypothetical protein
MAETRVEKYKDYRKSIIAEGSPVMKTAIETSLESNSVESNTDLSNQEVAYLKHVNNIKKFYIILILSLFLTIVILLIVFGIILF